MSPSVVPNHTVPWLSSKTVRAVSDAKPFAWVKVCSILSSAVRVNVTVSPDVRDAEVVREAWVPITPSILLRRNLGVEKVQNVKKKCNEGDRLFLSLLVCFERKV